MYHQPRLSIREPVVVVIECVVLIMSRLVAWTRSVVSKRPDADAALFLLLIVHDVIKIINNEIKDWKEGRKQTHSGGTIPTIR